jgi:hypothetical protein
VHEKVDGYASSSASKHAMAVYHANKHMKPAALIWPIEGHDERVAD